MPVRPLRILLWRTLAVAALLLGAVGIAVPVLPTVPFVLLAAWAASRGWPRLEGWLLDHAYFGAHIRRWRERGAVSRRAKSLATVMMSASALAVALLALPAWIKGAVICVLTLTAWWLWRRPEA
jgi:uncharacterized membrane protein YbaN (DUF454 family)